jgi:hypothetical protein
MGGAIKTTGLAKRREMMSPRCLVSGVEHRRKNAKKPNFLRISDRSCSEYRNADCMSRTGKILRA